MITTLYDENGDSVEGALDPDSARELQEKAEKFAEFEKTLEEKESELEKLRQKDTNFRSFSTKNKKELEERTKDWDNEKKILLDEIVQLKEYNDRNQDATVGKTKRELLDSLAGGDEKMKEKLEREYEVIGGNNAITPEDVKSLMNKAATYVDFEIRNSSNPVNTFQPSSLGSGLPRKTNVNFADTEEGKNLAKSMGLEVEVPKK